MFSRATKFSEGVRNRAARRAPAGILAAAIAAVALLPGAASAQKAPVRVLATVGMIADVAENVGGACVEVTQLMGPGVDPHLYQASARDVRAFRDAELILYAGYSLEGQLGAVLERFSDQKPTLAVAPASITPDELITTQDVYGIDPHLWMDASLWSRIAPSIAGAVAELAPDCADAMHANADAYVARLQALHDWAGDALATIPEGQRLMVTAHDAFAYFGRAYALEVAGIQGISTESEAGVADIREMARLVAERDVPAIFIETTINPRTIQAVIDAARDRGHQIQIGAELYSDAMGEPGTAAGTYIGMIYENTVNVTRELGGDPPPLPPELQAWAERWNVASEGE
ncbi:MAG: zinc ABC transporter substrate-binding protein [Trueperaceae bacterium]|nr:zinc ABC transporter substrate-binding protein [Trueperaceae bacterium]